MLFLWRIYKKKYFASFKTLTKFEWGLWLTSIAVTLLSYLFSELLSDGDGGSVLNMVASLIGVTALIFVAKSHVLGQLLTVLFSVFYGIISVLFAYYGEMITYLFMTTPMAIIAAIEWIKNPYKDTPRRLRYTTSQRNSWRSCGFWLPLRIFPTLRWWPVLSCFYLMTCTDFITGEGCRKDKINRIKSKFNDLLVKAFKGEKFSARIRAGIFLRKTRRIICT